MVFPLAMGAVVEGESCDFHTPLSGQLSPVRAVVPIGLGKVLLLIWRYAGVQFNRTLP